MNSNNPLVSVCIPVYNAGTYFKLMLDSIFNQSYDNFEVIISDNASTDETLEIAEYFRDYQNLKIYKNSENIGAEANFNKCLTYAAGEFVALFHADDIYDKNILKNQIDAFSSYSNLGVVFSNFNFINEKGKVIRKNIIDTNFLFDQPISFKYFMSQILSSYGTILSTPSALIKRELINSFTSFSFNEFGTAADLNTWLVISEKYDIMYLKMKHFSWRISKEHGSYTTRHLRTTEADYFRVINFFIDKYGFENFNPDDLNILAFYRYLDYQRCLLNANRQSIVIQEFSSNLHFLDLVKIIKKIKFKFIIYLITSLFLNSMYYIKHKQFSKC